MWRDVVIAILCIPAWFLMAPFVYAAQIWASRKSTTWAYN